MVLLVGFTEQEEAVGNGGAPARMELPEIRVGDEETPAMGDATETENRTGG